MPFTEPPNRAGRRLALDVDDFLVHIATPWIQRAMRDPRIAPHLEGKLPSDPAALTAAVVNRPIAMLQQWLVHAHGMPQGLVPAFEEIYHSCTDFYDELLPTKFCQGIIAALSMGNTIDSVDIITHCFDEEDSSSASKQRWLKALFGGSDRVHVHLVHGSTKKSDVMREVCPVVDAFGDDMMKNVVDVVLNSAVQVREILVPRMPHNSPVPANLAVLARERQITINYFTEIL